MLTEEIQTFEDAYLLEPGQMITVQVFVDEIEEAEQQPHPSQSSRDSGVVCVVNLQQSTGIRQRTKGGSHVSRRYPCR